MSSLFAWISKELEYSRAFLIAFALRKREFTFTLQLFLLI